MSSATKASNGTEASSDMLRRLFNEDPAVVRGALLEVARMGGGEADWGVVSGVAHLFERYPELHDQAWGCLMTLASMGADMTPVLNKCVSALRKDPARSRVWAVRWLREARSHDDWKVVNTGSQFGFLADILGRRPGTPEALEAMEWLARKAKDAPLAVARDLFLYWPLDPGPELLELVQRIAAIDPEAARRAIPRRPEREPLDLETALGSIAESATSLLVAEGQFSPIPGKVVRVGVLSLGQVLADFWVTPETLAALTIALSSRSRVRRGEWDVLYATAYTVAWTTDGAPFELWDRDGLRASQDGDRFVVRQREPRLVSDIECLEAYLDADWVSRGVRCRLKSGETLAVVEGDEFSAASDPTYDGIDLLLDASWVVSLAWAMGRAMGVRVETDRALRVGNR